jgi:hypothetical protein
VNNLTPIDTKTVPPHHIKNGLTSLYWYKKYINTEALMVPLELLHLALSLQEEPHHLGVP